MPRRLNPQVTVQASSAPVSDAEFAAAMAAIGDFEARPLLALAVSGGADSMALAVLAGRWATARGGACVALTVDHGLRPESADEAAAVGQLLTRHGLDHEILRWTGHKPATGVEDAARAARYRLLDARCRELGALHLLTAHHAGDQGETVLLRLCRGSGPDGLAGMAAVRYLGDARLLRPLLTLPADRLQAVCRAENLPWFDDPTNAGPGNARGRLRRLAPLLAAEGLTAQTLGDAAARAAAQRRLLEELTAGLLGQIAEVSPYGYIRLDRRGLLAADGELALRSLARGLTTVDGGPYPPRRARLRRLLAQVAANDRGGATLNGCLIRWRDDEKLLICREPAALAPPLPLAPGETAVWDQRFVVTLAADAPAGLSVAAAGGGGKMAIPGPARAVLPGLTDGKGGRAPADFGGTATGKMLTARFIPAYPLAGARFPVVSASGDII